MNYIAGGIDKSKGFPHILVVVRGGGGGGSEAQCILDREYEMPSPFLSLSAPPRHPSTAGLTEKHLQSPAERSRSRIRNLMWHNQASPITWDCTSEIN